MEMFQSQTGSQALSDENITSGMNQQERVSIPNGKPGPLRRGHLWVRLAAWRCFNPKREARPSQNGGYDMAYLPLISRFHPKREARPSQTREPPRHSILKWRFNPKREARPSQTSA